MINDGFIVDSDVTNDIINIDKEPIVTVKFLKSEIPEELIIEIQGMSVDNSVVNAIRRPIMNDIPVYGLHRSNIHIEVKKSSHMYDNDKIYCQLETLPLYGIPNNFDLENPEIYLSNDVMKKNYSNFIQEHYTDQPSNNLIDTNIFV